MDLLFVGIMALAPLAGVTSVMMASLSAMLGKSFGNELWGGATQSWLVVLLFLIVSLATQPGYKDSCTSLWKAHRETPLTGLSWLWGGLCSVYFVSAAVILPQYIGFGVFFVAAVCIEVFTALLLEFTGLFWTVKKKIKKQVIVGAVFVLAGTLMFQVETLLKQKITAQTGWMIVLALVAGFVVVMQTAFVRKISDIVGSHYRSYFLGQIINAAGITIAAVIAKNPPDNNFVAKDSWKLICAALFAFAALTMLAELPTHIGYAATYGWFIFGQLVTSMIIDTVGAFGAQKVPPSALRIIGVIIVLIGVALVQIADTKFQRVMPNLIRRITCRKTIPYTEAATETKSLKESTDTASTSLSSASFEVIIAHPEVPVKH